SGSSNGFWLAGIESAHCHHFTLHSMYERPCGCDVGGCIPGLRLPPKATAGCKASTATANRQMTRMRLREVMAGMFSPFAQPIVTFDPLPCMSREQVSREFLTKPRLSILLAKPVTRQSPTDVSFAE